MANPYYESALTERAGVEQPMQVNPNFKRRKKAELTVDDYVKNVLQSKLCEINDVQCIASKA